jgi:hypothetical protein
MRNMKALALSLVALGAFSVAASAEPVKLSKAKMDGIVAGANPHQTTNPGGQPGGCSNNPNCTTATGNPHVGGATGNPH